jgi:uncharacterized protein
MNLDLIKTKVKQQLDDDQTGHGFDHIERVLRLSLSFALKEKANIELVTLIALLHDVDDYKLVGIENAKLYKNALSILHEAEVDDTTQILVIENIQRIGYSRLIEGIRPTMLEGKVVSDADMCDAIGASGLLRVHAYGLSKGQIFFNPEVFPNSTIEAAVYKTKGSDHTINHFFDKLLKLKGLMMTDSGSREAILRHDFLVSFLKQFFQETQQKTWITFLDTFLKTQDVKDTLK